VQKSRIKTYIVIVPQNKMRRINNQLICEMESCVMRKITKICLYILIGIIFLFFIGIYTYMIAQPAFINFPDSEKFWIMVASAFIVLLIITCLFKLLVNAKKGKIYNYIFIGLGLIYLPIVILVLIQYFVAGRFFNLSALTDAQWLSNIGTIFTYIGTIFLGVLALNNSNEMKKIAQTTNELNTINKIIEIENKRFDKLQESLNYFSDICDPNKLLIIVGGFSGKDSIIEYKSLFDVIPLLAQQGRNLEKSFFETSRSLRQDSALVENDNDPFKQCFSNLFLMLKLYIENYEDAAKKQLAKNPKNFNLIQINSSEINTISKAYIDFIKNKEQYLLEQQDKLDKIIYGTLNLNEIKEIYKRKI